MYDPRDIQRWEGTTFFTKHSRYSIVNGCINGNNRTSLEGASVAYVAAVDRETREEIASLFESERQYSRAAHEKFDETVLKKAQEPKKDLYLIIGISLETGQAKNRMGLATSRIMDVK